VLTVGLQTNLRLNKITRFVWSRKIDRRPVNHSEIAGNGQARPAAWAAEPIRREGVAGNGPLPEVDQAEVELDVGAKRQARKQREQDAAAVSAAASGQWARSRGPRSLAPLLPQHRSSWCGCTGKGGIVGCWAAWAVARRTLEEDDEMGCWMGRGAEVSQ
jgi:hypothetical protein